MPKKHIIQIFESIKAEQTALLNSLIGKDLCAYNSGGWTPAQILQHLHAAQEGSIKVLLKKQEKGSYFAVPLSHRFNYILLRLFFYFGLKTKAPAIFEEPINEGNAEFFIPKYNVQHVKFIEIFEKMNSEDLKLAVFKHPLTGYMNAKMTSNFIQLHWRHHKKQILSRL